ncbi:hypothetical protein TVAG_226520 [Trichomonas vaginalis G3]|uniref:AIG1-type G domain-containing protein n=1 Tax=Trichomonas vaginalis (strain ATCC PRA-98 / G3) TaxID=412133 RepID=A2ER86_TRIV3|nr:GTPase, IMAP family member-related family [Trichomonas vaginalis G3]EAY04839.1 hypothetical protein TVAG_226520 [Trichomonas vaginalis G3]KAI5535361.1 GTPase, IMAP family member-related family [Trichomonas vaginalis G3]|eukprot:XP_001317062.1 hypothetical protein [Trichomonas vaginalis G3]
MDMEHNIMLIGDTGSGKSSLANCILDKEVFKTSQEPHACTKEPSKQTNVVDGKKFTVIDTEGFQDENGISKDQIHKLGELIRNDIAGLNVIAAVIRFSDHRFSQNVINEFKFIFDTFQTNEIIDHMCIIFSFYKYSADKSVKEIEFMAEVKNLIMVSTGIENVKDIPMFFLQTRKQSTPEFLAEIKKLRSFITSVDLLETKEARDAHYGYKEVTESEIKVLSGSKVEGDKEYEVYVDRERIKYILNNGAEPKFSEWKILRTYNELVKETWKEYDYHHFVNFEISGDVKYKIFEDRYKVVTKDYRTGEVQKSSCYIREKTNREVIARRKKEKLSRTIKEFHRCDSNNIYFKVYDEYRYKTIDFDGRVSYSPWKRDWFSLKIINETIQKRDWFSLYIILYLV